MKVLNELRKARAAELVASDATWTETGGVIVAACFDKETPEVVYSIRQTMSEEEFCAHVRAEMRIAGIVESTPAIAKAKPKAKAKVKR